MKRVLSVTAAVLLATVAFGAAGKPVSFYKAQPQFFLTEGIWYGTGNLKITVQSDGSFKYNVLEPVVITGTVRPDAPPVVQDPTIPVDPQDPVPPAPTVATLVVVYESNDMPIPLQVHKARDSLPDHLQLLVLDKDTPTIRYQAALDAGKQHGLPALVLLDANNTVLKTVTLPTTADDILNAN